MEAFRTRTRGALRAAALAALLVPLTPLRAPAGGPFLGPFPVGQPFTLTANLPLGDQPSCVYELTDVGVTPPIASPVDPPQFLMGAPGQTFSLGFTALAPGTATVGIVLVSRTGCNFDRLISITRLIEIGEGTPPPDQVLVVDPSSVRVSPFATQRFRALVGPVDENGNPDFGPDGVPGNADDAFELASVQWSVEGGIGSVAPQSGGTTTFTPGVPLGSGALGDVVATLGARRAVASVLVQTPGDGDFFGFRDRSGDSRYTFPVFDPAVGGSHEDVLRALTGPDTWGAVGASLQSLDPLGMPIEAYSVPLDPDGTGQVRSMPIVAVPVGGSIPGGPSGGMLFVQAQPGGSLIGRLAGFPDAVAGVVGPPTHVINLEVERMLRHGLPLVADAAAGAMQITVRPTTHRELMQSLDQLQIGANVLPFDASASLLGQLSGSMRTVSGLVPANLAALRQEILDDVARGRGDPSDPSDVERFLRRNPDRGRIVVSLGGGIERELSSDRGAYLGAADAGILGFREDLLLREAQPQFAIADKRGTRNVAIVVNLVEAPEVTNVLPYLDFVNARDRNRLRRDPSAGGTFQNAGQPGFGQLVVAADGSGHRRYAIGTVSGWSAFLYVQNAGEGSPASAFGLAHLVGHLLFGSRHDRGDSLSIMQPSPPEAPAFYEANFAGFHYGDDTLRDPDGQLDRRWRLPH